MSDEIIITIQHAAHVHFFRPIIHELEDRNHTIHVFVRDAELVTDLLEEFDIEYTMLVSESTSSLGKYYTQLRYEWKLLRHAREIRPDVITGLGGIAVSHVAAVLGVNSIVFIDSGDHAKMNRLGTRFADYVCTPDILSTDYGDKQVRYKGYHELSYLHPDRFTPTDRILTKYGIDVEKNYFVLRFIGWNAEHDRSKSGLSESTKNHLVNMLDREGTVYITSETSLSDEFEPYRIPVPPAEIHNLLFYANMYIGDSQTMATEAAILGTPAIRSNSFAGNNDMDNFIELEQKYDLLRSTPHEEEVIKLVRDWVSNEELQSNWKQKREQLLNDKIDVCEFATQFILRQIEE